MPVLAIFAAEVATGTGEAEPGVTGDKMIERCFFYGTDIHRTGFSIDDGIEFAFPVFPISAKPSFAFTDDAPPRTEKTLDVLAIKIFIEHRLTIRCG
jgi:hypothetical protein